MKKVLSLLLAVVMTFGAVAPTLVYADSVDETEQQNVQELADELEFYFEKAGHFDENGEYVITDVDLIKERANNGDEVAKDLLIIYKSKHESRSASDFGICILRDYFGVYIDLINGDLWDAFIGHIKGEAWTQAAKIVLKIVGKSASKANIVATAGQIAVAAYNCRGEW